MRYLLLGLFYSIVLFAVKSQDGLCPNYFIAGLTELPTTPDMDPRIRVDISIDSFFVQGSVGGYVSLVLVDEMGDSLTQLTGPDHSLPGNPSDTFSYVLELAVGLSAFPLHFRGSLYTTNPFCTIPVDQSLTSVLRPAAIPDLQVYPNPTEGWIKVSANGLQQARLFNSKGQLLLEADKLMGEVELQLDLWPNQLLFLQAITDTGASEVVRVLRR